MSWWRRGRDPELTERELDAELRDHVERQVADHVRAGMSVREARRRARLDFGGLDQVKERCRDVRGARRLEEIWHDLRFGMRLLARQRAFSVVAVLVLALGIGAATTVLSVVDGVLLRPVPFEAVHRLVMVWETDRASGTVREPASVPDFLDFREQSRQVDAFGALMGTQVTAATETGAPVRRTALAVSAGLLPLLGVEPLLGRSFTPDEARSGGAPVALISEALWSERFGRDAEVLGRVLRLDEAPATIVGVVPDHADLGVLQILSAAAYARAFADQGTRADVDVWVPLRPDPDALPRSVHPIFMVGRLAPQATLASARAELAEIAAELERSYPENDARGVFVEPLSAVVFGPVRAPLGVLAAAVALVLLIACANVANLVLVRATARVREVAVRQALGAGVWRLGRQFVAESLLLALLATAAGLALAAGAVKLLLPLAPADIPRLAAVALDLRAASAAAALGVVVGVAFGLLPLAQARRGDLLSGLRGRLRPAAILRGGRGGRRAQRRLLLVTQVALAVVLVIGAGLLVRSFQQLLGVETGFNAGGVLKTEYQLQRARYPADLARFPRFTETHAFNAELLRRVAVVPSVASAAIAGNHPLDAGATNSFVVIGREAEAADWPEITTRRVTPGYFSTVELALRDGRLFDATDDTIAPPVAVINAAAAQRFFDGEDPLGHELGFWGARRRVVGVVDDERVRGLEEAPPPGVYLPLAQAPSLNGVYALLARTRTDPAALAPTVQRIAAELDPRVALFGIEPLDHTMARSVAQRRFVMTLLGLFAAVAIAIAVAGVHGALSFDVARRTQEIGVRLTLGARPSRILLGVVGQGLGLVVPGLAIGMAAAWWLARGVAALLFGIAPLDPVTFAAAPVLVVAAAVAASLAPARRAAGVDPMTALRAE
ncbi:MAG: ABC transporter permease [Acidobacteria bacterium]|nr:ABC transporter permease [Acidobacteriota bacterium]